MLNESSPSLCSSESEVKHASVIVERRQFQTLLIAENVRSQHKVAELGQAVLTQVVAVLRSFIVYEFGHFSCGCWETKTLSVGWIETFKTIYRKFDDIHFCVHQS